MAAAEAVCNSLHTCHGYHQKQHVPRVLFQKFLVLLAAALLARADDTYEHNEEIDVAGLPGPSNADLLVSPPIAYSRHSPDIFDETTWLQHL